MSERSNRMPWRASALMPLSLCFYHSGAVLCAMLLAVFVVGCALTYIGVSASKATLFASALVYGGILFSTRIFLHIRRH